jgi:hypothetical protein
MDEQLVGTYDVVFLALGILLAFVFLIGAFLISYWIYNKPTSPSPYTGSPLRRGTDLSDAISERVLHYLNDMHDYDNRMFDVRRAAFCRETGRLFPDALTWYDVIRVDWSFLNKRYPGQWISWGSLSPQMQEQIRAIHHSLEGFQTVYSSPTPNPRRIEPEYALAMPGPLYVDLNTKILLGWKVVPETVLEVLIVQKPKGKFEMQRL